MKKLAVILALTLLVSPALAGMDAQVGDIVKVPNGGYDLGLLGGPITLKNQTAGNSFLTFCVEIGELIYVPNRDYAVSGIGDTTVQTGLTMSERTAWLYTEYRMGSLSGYAATDAKNDALQYAIWRSMGYTNADLTNKYDTAAVNAANSLAESLGWWDDDSADPFKVAGWSGFGNVRVANLTRVSNGEDGQDQLIMVPAPAAVVLGMLGVSAVALVRRRQTA